MLRSFPKLATISVIAITIAACSSDNRYKRQVSGNESYLDAPPLQRIVVPENLTLPAANPDFLIKPGRQDGLLGKQLDIRPPEIPFAALAGSQAEYRNSVAILTAKSGQFSWQQVLNILSAQAVPFSNQNATSVVTDYIPWLRGSDDYEQRGRYEIVMTSEGNTDYLLVKLLDLQSQQQDATLNPTDMRRYTIMMFNDIVLQLAKNDEYTASLEQAQSQIGNQVIEVQTSTNETGLPVIIMRSKFNDSWAKIQPALALMGMKITKQERSKGSMTVDYSGSISDALSKTGSANLPITKDSYNVTLGDLENRTSVQFNVKDKNKFLTAEENKIVAFVLQEALKQTVNL